MTAISDVVVPGVAALSGVVLTQAWNTWQERVRRRGQIHERLWTERKTALLGFLVALNQALDGTRDMLRDVSGQAALEQASKGQDRLWAFLFERYLEASLVFPADATRLILSHLDSAFDWQRRSVAAGVKQAEPRHEDLVALLGPWLSLDSMS